MIEKLKVNYSQIKEIKILDNDSSTNTFNTFNTFWNTIEKNGHSKNNLNGGITTKSERKLDEIEGNNVNNNENNQDNSCFIEEKPVNADKVLEVLEVLKQDKQTKDENKEQGLDSTKDNIALSHSLTNPYNIEKIEKFFASNNGQKEDHTIEDGICRTLIGLQNHKPLFLYCKICPKVENINLKSIEDHIRLKNPEYHKAKLIELIMQEEETKLNN